MSTPALTGLVTGVAGLVAAITALVGLFRHQSGPSHQAPTPPPPGAQP